MDMWSVNKGIGSLVYYASLVWLLFYLARSLVRWCLLYKKGILSVLFE
jgi:hypothetical protein